MTPLTRRAGTGRLRATLLVCCSTALALVFSEGALRLVLRSVQAQGYYVWPPHLKAIFRPSPDIMPGVYGESTFETNSFGIRGDELLARHTHRILAVGGSTTESEYLDQSETWPQQLQTLLDAGGPGDVWVGNAGVSGTTTRHHVLALQYLPLKEMKIDTVVLLAGINDLTIRLSHDDDYNPDALDAPGARDDLLAETFKGTYDSYTQDHVYQRTAIWQLLRRLKRIEEGKHFEDTDGKVYATWREHRRQASEMRDTLPDLSSALGEYSRNINTIVDLLRTRSIRPILVTQPTLWKRDLSPELDKLLWLGGIGDFQKDVGRPYYSAASLERGMAAYNDTLLRICRERGVECLDLASMLDKDLTVFYDDVHFNESGAHKVAAALSTYLLEHGFRQRPVTPTR